eukprot:3388384-Rhodomonas_salina.1
MVPTPGRYRCDGVSPPLPPSSSSSFPRPSSAASSESPRNRGSACSCCRDDVLRLRVCVGVVCLSSCRRARWMAERLCFIALSGVEPRMTLTRALLLITSTVFGVEFDEDGCASGSLCSAWSWGVANRLACSSRSSEE